MAHLTTDEILNFVTMESLTQEGVEFAARVNCHIMKCDECRKKVEAFQAINDGLTGTRLSNPERNEIKKSKSDCEKEIELL